MKIVWSSSLIRPGCPIRLPRAVCGQQLTFLITFKSQRATRSNAIQLLFSSSSLNAKVWRLLLKSCADKVYPRLQYSSGMSEAGSGCRRRCLLVPCSGCLGTLLFSKPQSGRLHRQLHWCSARTPKMSHWCIFLHIIKENSFGQRDEISRYLATVCCKCVSFQKVFFI